MTAPGGIGPWLPVLAVSVAALPVAYAAYRVRVRHYARRGVPHAPARRWARAEVAMVAGTAPWVWMILTPAPGDGGFRPLPLVDLIQVLSDGGLTAFVQVGGNVLVFAAFGFFAPQRWRIGAGAVALVAAGGSIAVEALQYGLALGRVASVDDVLLNAAGAGLAALVSTPGWQRLGMSRDRCSGSALMPSRCLPPWRLGPGAWRRLDQRRAVSGPSRRTRRGRPRVPPAGPAR